MKKIFILGLFLIQSTLSFSQIHIYVDSTHRIKNTGTFTKLSHYTYDNVTKKSTFESKFLVDSIRFWYDLGTYSAILVYEGMDYTLKDEKTEKETDVQKKTFIQEFKIDTDVEWHQVKRELLIRTNERRLIIVRFDIFGSMTELVIFDDAAINGFSKLNL